LSAIAADRLALPRALAVVLPRVVGKLDLAAKTLVRPKLVCHIIKVLFVKAVKLKGGLRQKGLKLFENVATAALACSSRANVAQNETIFGLENGPKRPADPENAMKNRRPAAPARSIGSPVAQWLGDQAKPIRSSAAGRQAFNRSKLSAGPSFPQAQAFRRYKPGLTSGCGQRPPNEKWLLRAATGKLGVQPDLDAGEATFVLRGRP
jgi:hypothetical protein